MRKENQDIKNCIVLLSKFLKCEVKEIYFLIEQIKNWEVEVTEVLNWLSLNINTNYKINDYINAVYQVAFDKIMKSCGVKNDNYAYIKNVDKALNTTFVINSVDSKFNILHRARWLVLNDEFLETYSNAKDFKEFCKRCTRSTSTTDQTEGNIC